MMSFTKNMIESDGTDLSYQEKTASIDEIVQVINRTGERSLGFWKTQHEQTKDNLERSISELHEVRETTVEFIKIDLLVGSAIIAIFQYGIIDPVTLPSLYIALPFGFLLLSAATFVHAYFKLGRYVVGGSSGGYLDILEDEKNEKEYYRIHTTVCHKWADDNIETAQKTTKTITFGIVLMFAALGGISGVFLFV